jgi:hypothetical protein
MYHRREILVEGLGVVADVHEEKPLAFSDRGRVQREVAFVEPFNFVHVWRADEPPVGGVCPRVIRALNRFGELPRGFAANPRAAMPADVEEGARLAVAVAQNDQRFPGDGSHDVVTWPRNPARSTDAIPVARKNALALLDEDIGRRVVLAWHRVRALLVRLDRAMKGRHLALSIRFAANHPAPPRTPGPGWAPDPAR